MSYEFNAFELFEFVLLCTAITYFSVFFMFNIAFLTCLTIYFFNDCNVLYFALLMENCWVINAIIIVIRMIIIRTNIVQNIFVFMYKIRHCFTKLNSSVEEFLFYADGSLVLSFLFR